MQSTSRLEGHYEAYRDERAMQVKGCCNKGMRLRKNKSEPALASSMVSEMQYAISLRMISLWRNLPDLKINGWLSANINKATWAKMVFLQATDHPKLFGVSDG